MKKILSLVLTACLAALLGAAVSADDAPAAPTETSSDKVAIRVSAQKRGEDPVEIGNYAVIAEGWEAAIDLAMDSKKMKENEYDRVVVDLLDDWNAVGGEFCNSGDGFNWDAIYFPYGVRVTLNMNGHTIDRGLEAYQYNGEVMYIDEGANVIINGGKYGDPIIKCAENPGDVLLGTISGGWSCNGAGGLHINDNAEVTLNNVNLTDNVVEDDDGAAVAVYDGAEFVMNGGSVCDNIVYATNGISASTTNGTVYCEDADATFFGVLFKNNVAMEEEVQGALLTASGGHIAILDGSKITGNGYADEKEDYVTPLSLIYAYDDNAYINISKSFITDNCSIANDGNEYGLIYVSQQKLNLYETVITGNNCEYLIRLSSSDKSDYARLHANYCTVTDNRCYGVFSGFSDEFIGVEINNSKFNNNKVEGRNDATFNAWWKFRFVFMDCEMGDSTYSDKDHFVFSNLYGTIGSVFGKGSVPMVISIAALVVSAASITYTAISNKKKAKPDKENAEDDE